MKHIWNLLAVALLLLLLLPLSACGDSEAGCPEGYQRQGAQCVPLFDDCPGPAEIPVLGGGCRAVGVTACAAGLFEPDGEGGCEPILPDHSCPPGTMERLGQAECQPVGVTGCAAGFESDGEGGCDAILPPGPDPCPSGTIALLGQTACQPLGDCGVGTWGNIVDDGLTVYVDQTADATGADGTAQAPFVTIGEALAVVQSGGQIAVAAGDYTERLTIGQPVRLTGRCAERVTIRGRVWLGAPQPPVAVMTGGTGTTLTGLTLTGPGEGLAISGARQVALRELQVLDAGDVGVAARGEAEVSLWRVVVAGCTYFGILSHGSALDLDQSVVRDTRSQAGTGWFGTGIYNECLTDTACGSLRVASSLVSGNRETGIDAYGADVEIIASVVRDTLPEEDGGFYGRGLSAQCFSADACGSLRVSSSVVSGNREVGISANGADVEVSDSVVRDTRTELGTTQFGRGIDVKCDADFGVCGSLQVTSCLVAGNRDMGLSAMGVETEVVATVVRDTLPEEDSGAYGRGVGAQCDGDVGVCGSLRIADSLVSGNREMGIMAIGVGAEVSGTVVRDSLSELSSGMFGRGISAQCDSGVGSCASLQVSSCVVTGNREAGISVFSVDAEITATLVTDTQPEQGSGIGGRGLNAQCDPAVAGCGSLQVSSSVFEHSVSGGIFIAGVPASLEQVAVVDTRSNVDGPWQDVFGQGIWALCHPETGDCGDLQMTSCLVDTSLSGGVAAQGVSGFINASVVRVVGAQPQDGKYGYGVQIGGLEGQQGLGMPELDVLDSLIRDAKLAGILYYRARGTLSGSVVSGAENSVIMNEGSEPTILDDNDLSGSVENEPTWANLFPSPAPPPALPSD